MFDRSALSKIKDVENIPIALNFLEDDQKEEPVKKNELKR